MKHRDNSIKPLRIGVVGAGFSGTALAALLARWSNQSLEIFLFDQSGEFGAGDAYRTPYPWHILNVRARDMSAFEDDPQSFVNWAKNNKHLCGELEPNLPLEEQFLPRSAYRAYLQSLIGTYADKNEKVIIRQVAGKVIDIKLTDNLAELQLPDQSIYQVDKVVLALGNSAPSSYPFAIDNSVNTIENPWNYEAVRGISKDDSVIIIGTGLSMIDAVLTLDKQGHQGKVYAVSRRGLLPLSHAESHVKYVLDNVSLTPDIRKLVKTVRSISRAYMDEGGDWRSIVNAIRAKLPGIWVRTDLRDKKLFLRHVLPYWNIHRHRVHHKLTAVMNKMQSSGQLEVLAGRIQHIENNKASILLRKSRSVQKLNVDWLINCIGPALYSSSSRQPLLASLIDQGAIMFDPLGLGLAVNPQGQLLQADSSVSAVLYTLGPPAKGTSWECTAVPEIRQQCQHIAKHILDSDAKESRDLYANTSGTD